MALLFELWVECESPAHAEQVVPHFNGLRHTLVTGLAVTWHAAVAYENARAVSVVPLELNRYGVATEKDRIEQQESALRLYHRLLTAPAFRYAHAARQAYLTPLEDLLCEYGQGNGDNRASFDFECVVDEEMWTGLGRPGNGRLFRPGYWSTISWASWLGRQWSELLSRGHYPVLLDMCQEVLSTAEFA